MNDRRLPVRDVTEHVGISNQNVFFPFFGCYGQEKCAAKFIEVSLNFE